MSRNTSEIRAQIINLVRDFVHRDVEPVAARHDNEDTYPFELVEKMKEMGLFGITIPEQYGGLGLDYTTFASIFEELSKGWMSVSGIVGTHHIMAYVIANFGTDDQKERLLPRMAKGEMKGGLALTEPEAGSGIENWLTAEKYRRAAKHLWADGADGIYLFNFFTCREKGEVAREQMLVLVGSEWRYYDKATAPSRNWIKPSFDDSAWSSGPGLFGYGNGFEATIVSYGTNPESKRATAYFRQTFEVDAVELIEKMTFKLLRDDAAAVYLNGKQIYRDSNLSKTARHTTYATSTIVDETAYATFEVLGSRLANGKNVVTAEVHQSNRTSSDLSFALFGKAHMLPGAWVTLKVDSSNYTNDLIYLNVKESPFTIVFDSKLQKTYTVEASTNLIDWDEAQVINGNGDSVEFNPTPQPGEKARFFRIRLNR